MEAPAAPATPSPATPLSSQDAKTRSTVATRRPLPPAFTRKRAQATSSTPARPPKLGCSGFALDGDVDSLNVSNYPQKSHQARKNIKGRMGVVGVWSL